VAGFDLRLNKKLKNENQFYSDSSNDHV
jgi:hypothetical protein